MVKKGAGGDDKSPPAVYYCGFRIPYIYKLSDGSKITVTTSKRFVKKLRQVQRTKISLQEKQLMPMKMMKQYNVIEGACLGMGKDKKQIKSELSQKLCNTRIQEFLSATKQDLATKKGLATTVVGLGDNEDFLSR